MQPRDWWVPVVSGVIGLAAGAWIAGGLGDPASPPVAPGEAALAAPVTGSAPGAAAFTLDDVRRVVRQELDARPSAGNTGTGASPAADLPDAQQIRAASQAHAVLDAAIARRSWTEADSEALREDFNALTADQQAELLRAYAVAVNQGRLVPQTDRAPF